MNTTVYLSSPDVTQAEEDALVGAIRLAARAWACVSLGTPRTLFSCALTWSVGTRGSIA